jgi:RIP metalloprotease RseP
VRQSPLDNRINLVVERSTADGKVNSFIVAVEPTPTSSGKSSIGLGVSPAVQEVKITKAKNIFEAASIGTKQTINLLNTIVSQFSAAASNNFDGASFGGPISILKTGAAVAKIDNSAVLLFAAMLSVNLGILNSIPLPILDGGQLAFVFIESLIGRKIPSKIQNGLTTATLLVMAFFSISLFVGDIVRDDTITLAPPPPTSTSSSVSRERINNNDKYK